MPNIIFTSVCNLHCQYCFADKIKNDNLNITQKELENILNWLAQSYNINSMPIGIIGGEPTLHSNFIKYLQIIQNFCNSYNTFCSIFTNGLKNNYIDTLDKNTVVVININDTINNNKLIETLDIFKTKKMLNINNDFNIRKVALGCNLYPEEKDYTFFWNMVDKYNINKIRMAVTSPSQKYRNNMDNYYKIMIPIYKKFCLEAYVRQIKITPDCAQIPQQYLKNIYVPNVFEHSIPEYCMPVIDIDKNLHALRCFGSNKKINCLDFKNYNELYNYLLKQDKLNNYKGCVAFYEAF